MARPAPERFNPAILYRSQQNVKARQQNQRSDDKTGEDLSFSVELPLTSFRRVVELIAAEASYNDSRAAGSARSEQVADNKNQADPDKQKSGHDGSGLERTGVAAGASIEDTAAALNALQTFRASFDLSLFSSHGFAADWTYEDEEDGDKLLATDSANDDRAAKAPVIVARGSLRSEMVMQCQRCLGHFEYGFEAPFRFVFAANEATANAMPDAMDPVLLDDEGFVTLVDMFEDELLLHVPAFARHENESDCSFDDVPFAQHAIKQENLREDGSAKRENPFSALKNMKFGDDNPGPVD